MSKKLTAEFKLTVLTEAKTASAQLGGLETRRDCVTSVAIGFANVADEWRTNRREDYDRVNTPAVFKSILSAF